MVVVLSSVAYISSVVKKDCCIKYNLDITIATIVFACGKSSVITSFSRAQEYIYVLFEAWWEERDFHFIFAIQKCTEGKIFIRFWQ